MDNEKEGLLVPVSVEELAILEAMAMISDCRVIDFKSISDRIDERAEKVGDGVKGIIGLESLVYMIFEYEKTGKKEAAQRISDELASKGSTIALLAAKFLDELEEDWRKKDEHH